MKEYFINGVLASPEDFVRLAEDLKKGIARIVDFDGTNIITE